LTSDETASTRYTRTAQETFGPVKDWYGAQARTDHSPAKQETLMEWIVYCALVAAAGWGNSEPSSQARVSHEGLNGIGVFSIAPVNVFSIAPVNVAAAPAGVYALRHIGIERTTGDGGFSIVVKGELSNGALTASLGKPKLRGRNVILELVTSGTGATGAGVLSPFEVMAQIPKLANPFVITIVNAKGERIDSRVGAFAEPTGEPTLPRVARTQP
jgi:hypothetical protein